MIPRTADTLRRRPELVALTGFGVAALLMLATVQIGSEIAEGETAAFDSAILRGLRNVADTGSDFARLLRMIMQDITALGDVVILVIVILLAAGFLLIVRKRGMALFLVAAAGLGTGLVEILKMVFDRARPDVVPHWATFSNASYPSGHAAISAIVYLTLAALIVRSTRSRRQRMYVLGAAIVLSFLIGSSRVYLGVHWPTDVLAGWIVGAGWAVLCSSVAWWLQARHAIESPSEGPLPEESSPDSGAS